MNFFLFSFCNYSILAWSFSNSPQSKTDEILEKYFTYIENTHAHINIHIHTRSVLLARAKALKFIKS